MCVCVIGTCIIIPTCTLETMVVKLLCLCVRALQEGYDVMVLNTNQNYVLMDGKKRAIRVRYNTAVPITSTCMWIPAHSFCSQFQSFLKLIHEQAFTSILFSAPANKAL